MSAPSRLIPAVLAMLPMVAAAADNGLGQTPYMGWSSWSCFEKNFDEYKIQAMADCLASRLKQSGYVYINVDAGWTDHCDEYGRSQPDPAKFPHGLAALIDYVHSKGLKFGLYSQPGIPQAAWDANCQILGTSYHLHDVGDPSRMANTLGKGFVFLDVTKPGAAEYIQSNVDLMASWGIDFLKLDFVGPYSGKKQADNRAELALWSADLKKCARPIWLELSNNLNIDDIDDWRKDANGWRIEGDIETHQKGQLTNWNRIQRRFVKAPIWAEFAGPGGWNDLDSLELGNGQRDGLTLDERRTAMTLWCIAGAPLYLGTDLRKLDEADYPIMTNAGALAVDQSGHPGRRVAELDNADIWMADNADGSYTVALFNRADQRQTVTAMWSDLGFHGPAKVRDLWQNTDLGTFDDHFSAKLETHASMLLGMTPLTQH
jgi:alpha-galactosidase